MMKRHAADQRYGKTDMSKAFWKLRGAVFALGLLLMTACSVVDVQVASLVTPTAPPPTLVVPPLAVEAQSSAGLVAYDAPDDDQVMVIDVASPHIVFQPDQAIVEMFPTYTSGSEVFVVNTGRGLRLRVRWYALWLFDVGGVGRVSMEIGLRAVGDADYQSVDSASTADFDGYGADHREELLDSTLYLPEAGDYDVRAVVQVTATTSETGVDTAQEIIYETRVMALNQPEAIPTSADDFAPAFGGLEAEHVFLDWRGWRYGPCYIQTDDNPDATRILDEACAAFERGEWDAAANRLQDTLNAVHEDVWLQNRLRQQLGTIAAASGQWNAAVRHFREGLTLATATRDALETGIALHNLAVALTAAGFEEETEALLWHAVALRDQMNDYPAGFLSYAVLAEFWDSTGTYDWVVPALYESGLAQADAVAGAADAVRQAQEADQVANETEGE